MERAARGLTLIELVVTLAVLSVLAALAFPGMSDYMDKQRLVSQMRAVADLAQLARSEAIKHSAAGDAATKTVAMTIGTGSSWFVGLANGTAACSGTTCVINQSGESVSHTVSGTECAACTLVAPTEQQVIVFDLRGLVSGGSDRTITLQSPMGKQLSLTITRLGRMSLCTPSSGLVTGYTTC